MNKTILSNPKEFARYLLENQDMFPNFKKMAYFEQNPKWHPEGNVQVHTVKVIEHLELNDPILTLCALAHDYGKTKAYSFDKIKGHRYLRHEFMGDSLVKDEFKQFNLTIDEMNIIMYVKHYHMRFHKIIEMRKFKVEELVNHKYFHYLYYTAKADLGSREDGFLEEHWHKYDEVIDRIRNEHK